MFALALLRQFKLDCRLSLHSVTCKFLRRGAFGARRRHQNAETTALAANYFLSFHNSNYFFCPCSELFRNPEIRFQISDRENLHVLFDIENSEKDVECIDSQDWYGIPSLLSRYRDERPPGFSI